MNKKSKIKCKKVNRKNLDSLFNADLDLDPGVKRQGVKTSSLFPMDLSDPSCIQRVLKLVNCVESIPVFSFELQIKKKSFLSYFMAFRYMRNSHILCTLIFKFLYFGDKKVRLWQTSIELNGNFMCYNIEIV